MKTIKYPLTSEEQDKQEEEVQKINYEKKISKNRTGFTWLLSKADIEQLEKIQNFESVTLSNDENATPTWHLDLKACDGYVGIYLCSKPNFSKASVKFEISILKNDGSTLTRTVSSYVVIKDRLGWKQFIKLNELLTDRYVKDGYITITCLMKVFSGTDDELNEKSKKFKGIAASFNKLLENEKFSDLTITVGDKKFNVHRAIIAARCSYFKTLFNESENKVITLDDLEPDVFQEVLVYIYTNKLPKISEMTDKLLTAAHKFNIENLAKLCDVQLGHNLKVETIAHDLDVARSCTRLDLITSIEEFIKENYDEVSRDGSWIELKKNKPELVTNALEKIIDNF